MDSPAVAIIDAEIEWCKEHLENPKDERPGTDFQRGFIQGLQQARALVRQIERLAAEEAAEEKARG